MSRREEIIEKAQCIEHYGMQEQFAFIAGAQWADKTMIEKVCDWCQCMALDYMQGDITDVKWGSMFADLRNYIENGDN